MLLVAGSAAAACDSSEACLAAIEAAQADTRTLNARFTQSKRLSLLDEPLVSTGRFVFARPDRMRLEVDSPHPAVIVVNGRDVRIPGLAGPDAEQLAHSPLAALFTELGAMFGGSPAALRRNFEVQAVAAGDGITVTLTPTLPAWQNLFRIIELRFGGPALILQAMRMEDSLGDRLDIVMSDVVRNRDVPADAFAVER